MKNWAIEFAGFRRYSYRSGIQLRYRKKIREGKVGGLFNIKGVAKSGGTKSGGRKVPFENPVAFGMDVIHGYQTVFPIPLGLIL